jgi:hypothetical protein
MVEVVSATVHLKMLLDLASWGRAVGFAWECNESAYGDGVLYGYMGCVRSVAQWCSWRIVETDSSELALET